MHQPFSVQAFSQNPDGLIDVIKTHLNFHIVTLVEFASRIGGLPTGRLPG